MIYPAFENSLSEGVLVAGTQRRFRVISAITGNWLQFVRTYRVSYEVVQQIERYYYYKC